MTSFAGSTLPVNISRFWTRSLLCLAIRTIPERGSTTYSPCSLSSLMTLYRQWPGRSGLFLAKPGACPGRISGPGFQPRGGGHNHIPCTKINFRRGSRRMKPKNEPSVYNYFPSLPPGKSLKSKLRKIKFIIIIILVFDLVSFTKYSFFPYTDIDKVLMLHGKQKKNRT